MGGRAYDLVLELADVAADDMLLLRCADQYRRAIHHAVKREAR
jgi:hypothetical protein